MQKFISQRGTSEMGAPEIWLKQLYEKMDFEKFKDVYIEFYSLLAYSNFGDLNFISQSITNLLP